MRIDRSCPFMITPEIHMSILHFTHTANSRNIHGDNVVKNRSTTMLKNVRGIVPATILSWINGIKFFALTAVLLMLAAFGDGHAATTNNLKIAFLNVEGGDSAVLVFPTGKTMLIDYGFKEYTQSVVIPFLKRHNITHLDYSMISHPHPDHDGNGAGISLLTSAGIINSSTIKYDYKSFKIGQEFTLEGTSVLILNAYNVSGANPNTNCIAFRMEYNGYVYQHGGDLDTPSLQDKIATTFGTKVRCNLFRTFHHMYGTISYNYLLKTDYQLAIVSEGPWVVSDPASAWPTFMKACSYLTPSAGHGGRFIRRYVTGIDGHVVIRISSGTQWTSENYTNLSTVVPNFPGVTSGTAYTITASTSAGGTINPSGAVSVSQGTNKSFTITPSVGYLISSLKVDNVAVTAVPTYTFNNVQAAHTISATFALAPVTTYTLTVTNGTGSGNYTAGRAVTITANAAPTGQVFNAWTGSTAYVAGINSPSTTVTMPSAAVTLTATYKTAPPVGGSTFVKGINMNGPALTMEGKAWLSFASATASGLSITSASTSSPPQYLVTSPAATFTPATDAATMSMLNTAVWADTTFTVNQTITNGNYHVYLWTRENFQTNFRKIDVKMENLTVASGIGQLTKGTWQKYGPYATAVTDGTLNIQFANSAGTSGDPLIAGIAIYSVTAAPSIASVLLDHPWMGFWESASK